MKIKCLFSCYCRHLFTNNKPQSPQARISSDLYRQSAWSISGGVFVLPYILKIKQKSMTFSLKQGQKLEHEYQLMHPLW